MSLAPTLEPLTESVPKVEALRRRRILFIDHTAKMGGGEIALLNLAAQIDTTRFEPTVLLLSDGPLAIALRAQGTPVIVHPIASEVLDTRKGSLGLKSLTKIKAAFASLRAAWQVRKIIRSGSFELVHTNSLKADLIGGVAGRLARCKVVWHVRDRIEDDYLPSSVVRVFRLLAKWIPHLVVANSNAVLRSIAAPGMSGQVIPSGVNFPRPTRVVYEGTPVGERVSDAAAGDWAAPKIVLVGRLAKWKGQHIFIDAAAIVHRRFPNARFQIIGNAMFDEAEYESGLRKQVSDHRLEGVVEMLGFRSDVPDLVRAAQIAVHASTTGEPFGQVITEAMALSKPVIATRGGGVPEIVDHGVTGLLVPMSDATAMAAAIEQLLSDPVAAIAMGERGYDRVKSHFTIQHTAAGVHRVYEHLLGPSPSRH